MASSRWISMAAITIAWVEFGSYPALAKPLANPPTGDPGYLGGSALLSAINSIENLATQQQFQHTVVFRLADGTKIGGLLYIDAAKGTRPLLIADYGIMSSRDSGLGGDFISEVVAPGHLNANFLVVDDISGSDFYAANESLGIGGYDAGRLLVELGQQIRQQGIPVSTMHLLGESLGGLAVLEALVEDRRLGTGVYQSAITFSGVVDENDSTATVFSEFGHSLNGMSGPPLPWEGQLFLDADLYAFNLEMQALVPGFTKLGFAHAGEYFYQLSQSRLQTVDTQVVNWNPAVDRSSVENYLRTSAALVSQIGKTTAPLIVVHAQNDPVVSYAQFTAFAETQSDNSNVLTLGVPDGSHCGFMGAYGSAWVALS